MIKERNSSAARRALLDLMLREEGLDSTPARQIPKRTDEGPVPLSYSQQRLWFLDKLEPGNPFYNVAGSVRLTGRLDVEALERSLSEVVRRHEALRTVFTEEGGQPRQLVAPHVPLELASIDLTHLAEDEREVEVRRLADLEASTPFDLTSGLLLRATLLRLGETEHALLLTMHHIASDDWSAGVLIREIAALYEAFIGGQPAALPELSLQYADYAVWQREWLSGETMEKQLDYWRGRLVGVPALHLPTDRPRPRVNTHRGTRRHFVVPRATADALKALGRQEGATLFMMLLAAFKALLQRYSSQADIAVGSAIANRTRVEIEGLIGFFVNTLVLRTDLSGDPTFRELLGRVKDVTVGAYAHQDVPFERLVEELAPDRDTSLNPLFQAAFVLQNSPAPAYELAGLTFELMTGETGTSKFDLALSMEDTERGVKGMLEYSTDLFNHDTVTRLVGHFQVLLDGVASNPSARLSALPLLTSAERERLLVGWNDTRAVYSTDLRVQQLVEARAAERPEALAVNDGASALSYGELNARANMLANYLRSIGVGPETIVGVYLERSADYVTALLAVLKTGGAYVPLDTTYPIERVSAIVEDASLPLLVTREGLLDQLPPFWGTVVCIDADAENIEFAGDDNPPNLAAPENLAYVIYTSGSTGVPKGVELTHAGLLNLVNWHREAYDIKPDDRATLVASPGFDASVWELWPYLAAGASLHVPDEEQRLSPRALLDWLDAEGVTISFLPTPLAELVLQEEWPASVRLRALLTGGDKLHRRPGEGLPCALVNHYGPTENTVVATCAPVDARAAADAAPSIGRPIANVEAYILDSFLNPTPLGVPGELYVAGAGLARGYRHDARTTAEKFLPHPFSDEPGARLYHTGDLVKYDVAGQIEFIGRIDHQVKLRGFRIELGEIETALDRHPSIRQSVVVIHEPKASEKRLVAYVVPQTGSANGEDESGAQVVSQWQALYDETYTRADLGEDEAFNIFGWNSSYTGEPIASEEMREWVEQTVERIRSLRPRRVLEIGCGTGLLLFPVAPECESYVATDFSRATIDRLAGQVTARGLSKVTLLHRTAENFDDIADDSFDVVVLNSVIQYFPSADYLLRVLEGAARAVRPGGFVFVGDVRSLPLLEAFHTSVQMHGAPPSLAVDQLRRRVRKQMSQEEEMVIDPHLFAVLKQRTGKLTHFKALLKRGRAHNELTKFRYDVILYAGGETPLREADWLDWRDEGLSLEYLRELLAELGSDFLAVRDIPNARVLEDVLAVRAAAEGAGVDDVSELGEAARASAAGVGIDPEDVWAFGAEAGFAVELSCAAGRADGSFDAVFLRRDESSATSTVLPVLVENRDETRADKAPAAYVNDPLREVRARELAPRLRAFLMGKLPEYMIPSAFIVVDEIPVTSSGKVAREALPDPELVQADTAQHYVSPRTQVEAELADIWGEVLGVERVGVEDNFFAAGGHSLLATQIMARVRDVLHVELPLRSLFESPTVEGLAGRVEEARRSEQVATHRITRASREGSLPLSFPQQRLWFLDQLEPGNPFYNGDFAVRLSGALDAAALSHAFDEVVQRHESLRTRFIAVDGEPVQIIDEQHGGVLTTEVLSHLPHAEREAEAIRLAIEEAKRPFNLSTGPVFRARLLKLEEEEHVLLLTMHHIVSDWWSIGVFVGEVSALYQSFIKGEAAALPELSVQFADFAHWQRSWLEGNELERQRDYWVGRLRPEPAALELPTDRPRPAVQSYRGARRNITLPPELVEQLKALGEREGATLFMVLLAAFKVLMWRYTGQEDIAVGTAIANRTRAELEPLIGFFVNTLVLRTQFDGGASLSDVLGQVRERALQAYAHQDMPFEKLVEEVMPERDLSRSPLFQVFFQLRNAPMPVPELPGVRVTPLDIDNETSIFDLTVTVQESPDGPDGPDGLTGNFRYNADLFDGETIERMIGHYRRVLELAATEASRPIGRLSLLSASERRQVVEEWNATDVTAPPHERRHTVHELFEEQVRRTPSAVAVEFYGRSLTYAELNAEANRLAHHLISLGVGPDSRVGLFLERGVEQVLAVLASLKAGGAYVPLDTEHPEDRLRSVARGAGLSAVITTESLTEKLSWLDAPVVRLDADRSQIKSQIEVSPTGDPRAAVALENLAYVLYTSGSTGTPKGVAMTHAALANMLVWQTTRSTPTPARTLQFASLGFDVSFQEIFSTWCAGGTLVLVKQDERRDSERLLRFCAEQSVERLFLPFVALQHLALAARRLNLVPPDLRQVITAGEQLHITEPIAWMFKKLEGATLHNQYGPTEAHVVSEFVLRQDTVENWPELAPIGRPISNARLYVLDDEMRLAPVSLPGDLYIGGEPVARAYLGAPALTAERFVPDPFSKEPGVRLYKTGDRARWLADGAVQFLGRADSQVKVRGYRVEPGEVEAALLALEGVKQAAVVARRSTQSEVQLHAYVAAAEGVELEPREVRARLSRVLPEYMVPVALAVLPELPLTASGKIDRRHLPEVEPLAAEVGEWSAPRGPVEEAVAAVWAEVLGVKAVGARSNFFELGGHSLLATRVMARVREVFAVDIPLRALFEQPTVEGLSRVIGEALRQSGEGEVEAAGRIEPGARGEGETSVSYGQRRLWFLQRLEPESAAYNLPMAIRLVGRLDVEALEQTLNEIVRRHEILRTTFDEVAGQPVQVIAPAQTLRFEITDLSEVVGEQERTEAARRLALEEAREPFDLSRGPLLRARLLKLGDEEHVALFTMHHIVSDGWSIGLLVKEVAALYEAFVTGRPSPLPALSIQYADYAAWQSRWLDGGALERQLVYWRQQLGGAQAALDLPTDRRPPATRTRRGAHHSFSLSKDMVQALGELSRRQGTTMFMTLLAAFQSLLGRYSGQQDISTGTPVAGRGRAETEDLIGFFVNTLVLRTDLSGDPTFNDLLRRVREVCLGAYTHGDVPFEKLVEALQTERNLDHTPLFRVMFALQNTPLGELSLRGLRLSPVTELGATAMFDLTLNMQEVSGEIRGSFIYDTDLFDAATIERMAGHFTTLLEATLARPESRISELPLLDEAERRLLVEDFNDTRRDYQRDVTVHQLFEAQAARTPTATAVVFGEESLTYAELNERANRLAHHLSGLGVGPESLVGVCLERTDALLVGLLGVLKAGGAYVPLDPEYPRERIRLTLADAGVGVLLTEASLLDALSVDDVTVVCLDRDAEAIARASAENPSVPSNEVAPDNLAYMIYTSGSTGRPKGVAIEHRSAAVLLHWSRETFSSEELSCVLASTSICFDLSVFEMFAPLAWGGRVVVAQNALALPALGDKSVTLVNTVPSAMAELVRAGGVPDSVLTVNLAGEPLKRALVEQVYARTSAGRVWNLYGPSEDTTYSTFALIERGAPGEPTIGRPVANTRAYVLDRHLRPVPASVVGELYLGGEGLARGYHGRPSLTAERFVPDPYSSEPGARLYKTGDLAKHLPGGALEFLGRVDQQVKVRGYRVELGEIETAARGLAWIRECVAAAWGEGAQRRLVLYVEREPSGADWEAAVKELRTYMRRHLPGWMVPEVIVEVGRMPLTPTGKIDRRALPDPEPARSQSAGKFVAPRTPVEELLAQIWSETLGLDGIGRDDNFFELGGHSLLATQAVSRVREMLGVELPLRTIFEAQTLGELAAHVVMALSESQGAEMPPFAPVERENDLPLSFAQQRLWFLDQMEPGLSVYNMPGAVRLTGTLDIDALERSLAEVIGRHEVLRTHFATADGLPVQVVNAEQEFTLALEDLRGLSESELLRRVSEEAERPFDLSAGPLVRARLFRVREEEHVLLVTMHHIVSDGWSIGLLIREVAANYAAFVEGGEAPAPALPIQYGDYAVWQRGWLRGEALEQQMGYWRRQLGGELPVLDLPADRPRPAVQSYRGARRTFELPADLSAALKGLSRREGATLFMTVLAAFKIFLHRYTGAEEVVVGTDIAGRNRRETEGLIGFFANQLVLRTEVSGNPTFSELLSRVREVALGAYAHQDVPFEKLVEELQPARDLSRPPLFQIKFVWQQDELEGVRMPGLSLTPFDVEGTSAKFDLTLFMVESEHGLGGMFEYNTDIFDGERIGRMLEHFLTVLAGVAASPECHVGYLPLLSEDERQTVLDEWNSTRTEALTDLCVHQLFAEQAGRTPHETALSDGERRMSYAELNAQSNRLASHLRNLGVGPDVPVGVCLRRSLDMVTAVLGVLKAGGAFVPLDPSYPTERLSFMLADAAAPVLLTQEDLIEELPSHWGHVLCIDSEAEAIAGCDAEELDGGPSLDNLAYVIYTSGSTGKPKGVMVTHGGLVNYLSWAVRAYDVDGGAGAPLHSPLGFDLTVTSLFAPLVAGRGVTLLPEGEGVDALAEALTAEQEFSLIKLTPSHLDALKGRLDGRHLARAAKTLVLGGEALSGEAIEWWRTNAPETRFVNEYGPTETVVGCCVYEVPAGEAPAGTVPIGRPIANTRLYVLDRSLEPVPVGVAGELYIAGEGVSRGYLNRPGLTAETFLPDPFGGTLGARMYKSGDAARFRDDGTLDFLGRLDDQVKVRGYRIELGEIEAALRRHTSVREAAVALHKGAGRDVALVAYVIGEDGSAPDAASLRAFLKDKLPEYMIPSAFVALNELPLTANGKVNRRALPAPERASCDSSDAYVAPRTQAEAAIAGIWEEVLDVERVGVHDNFFDLGGHSLLATYLVHKAGTHFGVNLFLRDLFSAPTVAEFAVAVARQKASRQEQAGEHLSLPRLTPAPAERYEPFALTEIQQAYWIGRGGDFELSNVAAHGYLELEGEGLDLERLNQAIRRCVERHDMLRAVVTPDGFQCVLERVPEYEVDVSDLRGLDAHVVAAELGRIRDEMSHEVRRADRWPLFEIRVSLLDDGRMRFYLSIDALICDAWSVRLLAADLTRFYNEPDTEAAPPELTFRDYTQSVLSLKEGELYRDSADYWRGRLTTLPRAPELPLACDPGSLAEPQFKRREMLLGRDAWQRLKERAGALGLTHSGVLLAAYSEVLAAWSKSAKFTINLTLFNRLPLHAQVNDLVGDFTSIILLAVDASRAETFETRALRLQEQLWDDIDHRHFSGVSVLRELSRQSADGGPATMPVVFTSVLMHDEIADAGDTPFDSFEVVNSITQTPQVWLDNQVTEHEGELRVIWDAVEELFPEGVLSDMFDAYCRLLERLAEGEDAWREPSRRLLPGYQAEQRAEVNATDAPVPEGMLHTLFQRQVPLRAREAAVISSARTLTYEELERLSNQTAHLLREAGARPNALVAVVMEKGWEQVVAVLGVLQARSAYLPISPEVPAERLRHLLEHGEVELVLTQPKFAHAVEWPDRVRTFFVSEEALADVPDAPHESAQGPEDLAYVIYTSGSTGLPKGVMIDHRGAVNTVLDINRRFSIGPEDRVLALSSLSFDLSVYDIFGTLAAGGAVVIPEPEAARDPARWAQLVNDECVTVWNSVPALMELFVDYVAGRPEARPRDLRLVMLSGDWIATSLPERIRAAVPQACLFSLGGATEASIWSIIHPVEEIDPELPSIPYGKPMVNQRFYVLNEALEPCPTWVPGDLYIGGVGLALGYWRDEALTNGSFIENLWTKERLYRTGDVGRYLPDGNIQFLGREDSQVKIQGYRVELGEIEAALVEHPDVRAAVVTAVGKAPGPRRLVGHVAGPAHLSGEVLREFLRQKLPSYMVPSSLTVLDELPLTSNGKVDRRALSFAAPADAKVVANVPYASEGIRARFAALVASVVKLDGLEPGANLLELGASSVDIVRIVNLSEKELGFRPRVDEFYMSPTVEWLAWKYEEHDRVAEPTAADTVYASLLDGGEMKTIAGALAQLKQLSPEEVARLLAAGRAGGREGEVQ